MNWLDWTPKGSNIEKGCHQAPPKPPKPAPPFPGYPTSFACPECGAEFTTSPGRARHMVYDCPKGAAVSAEGTDSGEPE